LKEFPKYYPEEIHPSYPGELLPVTLRRLVPRDCGLSTQQERTLIDEEVIKIVVDWMEANKGKYELVKPVKTTF
jgi:hypothetical protein